MQNQILLFANGQKLTTEVSCLERQTAIQNMDERFQVLQEANVP